MRTPVVCSQSAVAFHLESWDEDDLVTRLSQALDFADRVLHQLSMDFDDVQSEQTEAASLEQSCLDDFIARTAVFLLSASKASSYAAIGPRVLRVATLLLHHAHSRRVLQAMCLRPSMAFEYATAHICLKRLGFYDADFDAMLDLAAASQSAIGRERKPCHMLQQEWLRQGWLYPEGMRRLRVGSHVASSVLNRSIDLLHCSQEDVCYFTCALAYMTDFNIFPRSLPRTREVLLNDAEVMIAHALDAEDYDQVADLLLAWPLTGEGWSPTATFAFRTLVSALNAKNARQDCVSASELTIHLSQRRSTARDTFLGRIPSAAARTFYSTGMLCAASLADRRLPPCQLPLGHQRSGVFEALLSLIDRKDRQPLWQVKLAELEPEERESLAEFLLCIALHRSFRRHDFKALHRVIDVGKALGCEHHPLLIQATEMVSRVRQFSSTLSELPTSKPESSLTLSA